MGRVRLIVDDKTQDTTSLYNGIKARLLELESNDELVFPETTDVYIVPDDEEWPSLD